MSDMQEPTTTDATPPTDPTQPPGPAASAFAAAAPPVDESAPVVSEAASDFKQLYTLLFCCTAIFIATMWMPIERHLDLYAKDSISGGFLAVFAAYGVFSGWMNIHNRKMIVWPAFFAAGAGIYLCTMRAVGLIGQVQEEAKATMTGQDWIHLFGSGFYVISTMSLLVIWTLLTAVMSGAKKEAARKEASKAARSSKKI